MKRALRKYIAGAILFCLAVQLVPMGLIHTHYDHHGSEDVHVCHADHDFQDLSGDNDNSDFQFENSEDCNFCDAFQILNDQNSALNKAASTPQFALLNINVIATPVAPKSTFTSRTQGRAPPVA